jgi:hypothetical protein
MKKYSFSKLKENIIISKKNELAVHLWKQKLEILFIKQL